MGDSALLTASGGTSYKWGNGSTTSSIWVVPSSTTTYTLEAFAGTCNNTTTVTVHLNPATTATISKNDTICSKTTVTLTTTGSGGPVTYKWSTGATTSAINVSPDSTTTYTATVYGKCDTVKNTGKDSCVSAAIAGDNRNELEMQRRERYFDCKRWMHL